MAAVKKLIDFARKLKLENVAKVLESAYVDDCNSSVGTENELEEVKEKMPQFMLDHGMPIKALAWSGSETPTELSSDGLINTAGFLGPQGRQDENHGPQDLPWRKKEGQVHERHNFLQRRNNPGKHEKVL